MSEVHGAERPGGRASAAQDSQTSERTRSYRQRATDMPTGQHQFRRLAL